MSGIITIGFVNYAFLRFCLNHARPFGFRWEFLKERCPKCGPHFIEDRTRSFVMIAHGYTITQRITLA